MSRLWQSWGSATWTEEFLYFKIYESSVYEKKNMEFSFFKACFYWDSLFAIAA